MESNLLASLARGERIPLQKRVAKEGPPLEPEPTTYDTASESSSNSNVTSKQGQPLATSTTTTRVRTISGMNEHLLAQLQQQQHHPMQSSRLSVGNSPSNYHGAVEKGRPPLPRPPPTLSSSIPPTTTITLNVVSQKPQNGGAAPMSLSISPANSSGSSYNNNNTTTSVDTNRDNGRVATRVEAPPTSDANSQRRQHIEKQFSMNELELSPEEDHAKQPFGDDSLRGEALLDRLLVDLEVSDDEEDDSSRNAESDPRGVISPSEDMTTESFTISGSHAVGNSMSNSSSSTDNTSDKRALAPLSHIRRNTAGNVAHAKAGTTMDKPDIDGTIHVVCGVIRVHMEEYLLKHRQQRSAIGSSCPTLGKFNLDIFRDDYETNVEPRRDSRSSSSPSYSNKALPSLEEIKSFYHEFFKRSQMEFDAIIMSLIYVERLVKETNGALMPTPDNWGSVVFSCMVLASKVWDDLSMWNIDFSNVSVNSSLLSSFSLKRINQLELGVLTCLNFAVTIPGSEYAKYYYLLRNMMIRGGLLDPFAASQTLTKDEKSRFEDRTTRYQEFKLNQDDLTRRRVKSVDWSQLASSSSKTSTGVVSSEFAVPGKTSSGHHFHLLEPLSDPLQHQPLSLGQLIATSKAT